MQAQELDKATLLRARAGDSDAFARLVRAWEPRIFNLAWHWTWSRDEAADLAQEIFLRLFRSFDRYDPEREFAPWFFTLAANLCRNWIARRRMKTVSLSGDDDGAATAGLDPAAPDPAGDPRRDVAGIAEEVNRALGELPPDYRAVIALHYQEGLEVASIAATLDVPVGTVKTWLFRARDRLRTRLRGRDVV
ncbi:MAG: sigma-70 family RNA polymerase sigma factor [Planctomycetes bacterium]|nr:sigma-70 family RNA polymerase sigma factor [Planctomycetota bacterium]